MNFVVVFTVAIAVCHATSINLLERDDKVDLLLGPGNPARRQTGVNLGFNTHSGTPQFTAGIEKTVNGGNTKFGANANFGFKEKPNFDFSATHNIDSYTKLHGNLNVGQHGPTFGVGISREKPGGPSWFGNVNVGPGGPSIGAGLKWQFGKRNSPGLV